jgi:hypothetical protein
MSTKSPPPRRHLRYLFPTKKDTAESPSIIEGKCEQFKF